MSRRAPPCNSIHTCACTHARASPTPARCVHPCHSQLPAVRAPPPRGHAWRPSAGPCCRPGSRSVHLHHACVSSIYKIDVEQVGSFPPACLWVVGACLLRYSNMHAPCATTTRMPFATATRRVCSAWYAAYLAGIPCATTICMPRALQQHACLLRYINAHALRYSNMQRGTPPTLIYGRGNGRAPVLKKLPIGSTLQVPYHVFSQSTLHHRSPHLTSLDTP